MVRLPQVNVVQPPRFADARNSLRHVFIHDLEVAASIGVHNHEKEGKQRIRINLDLAVREGPLTDDSLANVVCYEKVVSNIRQLVDAGHVNLVETLAERIAALCLEDRRVRVARVRVEKLDVFADAASVGVEIERCSVVG
jgi:7,8-dihydroneopterin aldolase/epimerase/oxygenase